MWTQGRIDRCRSHRPRFPTHRLHGPQEQFVHWVADRQPEDAEEAP